MLIAPAGFGKTTALQQYLVLRPGAIAFDVPRDATLASLVRAFVDLLATHVALPADRGESELSTALRSPSPGRVLAAWMRDRIRGLDRLVVIDGVQAGDADPEVARFISALIDATVADAPRWLIASRSTKNLSLAAWLARGDMDLAVDAIDLRFSLEEARASARLARLAVREEELSAIVDILEGWPAAMTFALCTATHARDLLALEDQSRDSVYAFLAERVYRNLDAPLQSFARAAVLLPYLDREMAQLLELVPCITALDGRHLNIHELFCRFVRTFGTDECEGVRDDKMTATRA
ncbi:MAG: hypothetical protein NVS2B17_04250 [Candidatus Velthaea sp.]